MKERYENMDTGRTLIIVSYVLAIVSVFLLLNSISYYYQKAKEEVIDRNSFYLGATLSTQRAMVTIAYDDERIGEEEFKTYQKLVEEVVMSDEITFRKVISCIKYASGLGIGQIRDMTEIKEFEIDKKSFGYGFDLQDTYVTVLAYHMLGLVEDEIYQKMESEFHEVYEAPSRENVEDYVHKAAEIVKQAEEKITEKG